MIKNLPFNKEDVRLVPGQGTKIPLVVEQACMVQLLSACAPEPVCS